MAILKRIPNKSGDGAGRSRYTLQKAIAVRTDIPSPLSLLIYSNLTDTLRNEIADEFNRFLLRHQGNYKTSHYVVSFGHFLSDEEVEEVLDKIQQIFDDLDRYHLYVVHKEAHGTAVHVIESANRRGQLRRLSPQQFHDLKRRVIDQLSPYMNARELEVARNYQSGIVTQDWKQGIEIYAPERSWKEYIRQSILEAVELIEQGYIDEAVELLESRNIKIEEYKAGELSPKGRLLKRNRTYAILGDDPNKSIRLEKRMKATFQIYQNLIQESSLELEEIERVIEETISGTEEPGNSEGRTGERNRTPGGKEERTGRRDKKTGGGKEIYIAEHDLFIPAEGGTEEGSREPQIGREEEKDGTFGDREEYQEFGESEKCSFCPDRREKEGAEEFRIEHREKESGTHYCQPGTPGTARGREETEMVEEKKPDNRNLSDIRLGGEILLHPTPKNRPAYSNDKTVTGTEESTNRKTEAEKPSTSENDFTTAGKCSPTKEEELKTPEKPFIPQEEEFTTSGKPDADTGPIEPLFGKRDNGESSGTLESEDIGERGKSVLHPGSGRISDIPQEREELGDNQGSLRDMRPSPGQGKWTINGEEITEDDIRENPALYTRCEIEEVQRLAWDYLLEEIDEEVEFLEKTGYFRDIEELEEVEEKKKEERVRRRGREKEDKGLDFGI